MNSEPFSFSGNELLLICPIIDDVYNNFTYEFIVKPTANHEIDEESALGTSGISGKRYAIGPGGTSNPDKAGMGVSVGANGISVYEHTVNHLPAVLVHETAITEEIHVAIIYQQKTPYLFVNGNFVKKGQQSKKKFVHPSIIIGGLHPYGFYSGELKNIRIWDHVKTVEQIRTISTQQLIGKENGLYFLYNRPDESMTFQSKQRNIEVSIIIPSHNKYPENLFTLHSLANQNYDLSKVEVIFIDDSSTDATSNRIDSTNYPFLMKYIHLNQNRGRPHSRNVGLHYAIGEVIIFADAETIVPKDFIKKHLKAHEQDPNIVVSAVMNQKGVYTVFDPSFSVEQQNQCVQIMQTANYPLATIKRLTSSKVKTPIITHGDINNETYKRLSFEKTHESIYKKQLLTPFGHTFNNFHMPWLSFYTGNASVQRHLLQKAGFFEEKKFEGYGWEDTELGYRLHQVGATFMHYDQIITFHQEHPIHPSIHSDAKKNAYAFFNMYQSDFSALIISLLVAGQESHYTKLNGIVNEYKRLEKNHPHSFEAFKQGVKQLLLSLAYVNAYDLPKKDLLDGPIVKMSHSHKIQFKQEIQQLKQMKTCPFLIESCERLINL